ncbi:disulfide oxidoreductase [Pseudalkalibacillus decolorationis]|uniref:disulfide oxidoreductase n=1 Tax=Pseudalkalibacillus decolorationis TaxID=163879 RepID=UPI00214935C2|nr:disulfide oxidoreductase [Pseudalkalibacillus decolorationis]
MNKLSSFAWITSIVAVLGSLYFSEMAGFVPCELCWYQRILMYPLVVIIGIGLYTDDLKLPYYVLPLSVLGILLSSFHYLHQKTDWFDEAVACTEGVPCSGEYINWLGFITIPFLALVAFVIITVTMILQLNKSN